MTLSYKAQKLIGLANDTKPPNIEDWEEFTASDTFETWKKIAGAWYETTSQLRADYSIYKASTGYKARNNVKGFADIQNTNFDIGQLINDIISAMPNGAIIHTKPNRTNKYTVLTPVALPVQPQNATYPYIFTGVRGAHRYSGTTFEIGSTFPTGNYVFQGTPGTASTDTITWGLEELFFHNPYARSGTNGQNINAGSTVIDAGIIKSASAHTNGIPNIVRNVQCQYMWRGLHYIGYQYFGEVNGFQVLDQNINEVADCMFIMEKGGYTDYPKLFNIQHMTLFSQHGFSGGTGSMNIGFCLGGAYHNVRDLWIDGMKYNEACIAIKQGWTNKIYGIGTEDLNVAQGASFKAPLLFDTNDFSGNAATHSPNEWTTYDNKIYNASLNTIPNAISYQNGAYRNRVTVGGMWGLVNIVIDDVNAGIDNVVVIEESQQPTAYNSTRITTTNTPSKVKIIDIRANTENRGTIKFNGDGSTKVFNIPHGLYVAPNTYFVRPLSADCQTGIDVSVTSTYIVVTLLGGFAPPTGTNNVVFGWYANIY